MWDLSRARQQGKVWLGERMGGASYPSPTLLLAALLRSKGKIQMRDCPLRTSQLLLSGKSPPSRSQCPPLILLAVDIRPEKGLVRPWNQSVWLSGRRLSRETSPLKP